MSQRVNGYVAVTGTNGYTSTNGTNGYSSQYTNGHGVGNGINCNGYKNGHVAADGYHYKKGLPETNGCARNDCDKRAMTTDFFASYTYEDIKVTTDYLMEKTQYRPKIGIICGSGLGVIADSLTHKESFPYDTIPNFPVSTVKGHAGQLVFGLLEGVPVVCMKGRFHYYEGYPICKCAMPVRVMKMIGADHLITTCAAGGLNDNFNVGDIMVIKDHVNIMGFAGVNPLRGPNDERFGTRFPAVGKAYDAELRTIAKKIGQEMGISDIMREGVYSCLGGPNFETVAELRAIKILGIDAVGMSTVHEVIVACHSGMKVFAFSLITNKCVTSYESDDTPEHEEVMEVGKQREKILQDFVARIIQDIKSTMK